MNSSPRPGVLSLVLLVTTCGCSERDSQAVRNDAPNVLLVTLDTTRADRLGCYGYEGARTPTLDALAASGVRFDRAYTQVPLTLPSHASLLSGVHPAGTGLQVNFQGTISAEVPLLAEFHAAEGYRTAAFTAAWVLNHEFGLDRGFEVYQDLSDRSESLDKQVERSADQVVDAALAWLEEVGTQRFFCWLHFFDPHDPHRPPEGFTDLAHPYDGEIAFVDAQLGRVIAWLEARELRARTLIVVAGDHGEGLGEHDEFTHGLLLYESTLRVPLIFSHPGTLREAGQVGAPVALVDVFPTILELCGGEVPSTVEGKSLVAPLRGLPFVASPVYAETEYPLRSFHWAAPRALITGSWKYVEAPVPELYSLVDDPGETNNRAMSQPTVAEPMREALREHRRTQVRRQAGLVELGLSAGDALAALGYVEGVSQIDESIELEALRDPKTVTHVFRGVMRAKHLADEGDHAAAASLLSELVDQSPESGEIWALYGMVLAELHTTGTAAKAEQALKESLRTRPDHPSRLRTLGEVLEEQGKTDEALATYTRALRIAPDDGQLHSRKGRILARLGEWGPALEHFERCVELEPRSANARTNLANLYFATQRFEEGLAELEVALECDPACAPAHLGRLRVLELSGHREQARAALELALEALPEDGAFAAGALKLASEANDQAMIERLKAHQATLSEKGVGGGAGPR